MRMALELNNEGAAVTKVVKPLVMAKHDHLAAFEWESLRTCRHNLLLEGPTHSTDSLLRLLVPHLPKLVLWNPIRTPYALLARECGALVLQNIAALNRTEQGNLRRWVEDCDPRRQVISTSARPLFPLVAHGLFDEVLYYRLNLMLVRVGPAPNGGPTTGASLSLSHH